MTLVSLLSSFFSFRNVSCFLFVLVRLYFSSSRLRDGGAFVNSFSAETRIDLRSVRHAGVEMSGTLKHMCTLFRNISTRNSSEKVVHVDSVRR